MTDLPDAFAGAPDDELEGGRPWFVDDDEEPGDPRTESPGFEAGFVWVITVESDTRWDDGFGPGLSLAATAATARDAVDFFEHSVDSDPVVWYRGNADGTYWQAIRWEPPRGGHWSVHALTQDEVLGAVRSDK